VHAHDRGSNTFVTDQLYDTLNDFEEWIEDQINSAIQSEFRDSIARKVLTLEQQNKLKRVILKLVRNSYSGPINLNKLMDPYRYEPYKKPEAGKTYDYVGPFKSDTSQSAPYVIGLPEKFKQTPIVCIVDLNPPADQIDGADGGTPADVCRVGLFNVRQFAAEHKAPIIELKDDGDVRIFLRYIAYHLFACHENPVEKLIEKMIKIKRGKRDHSKDGFVSVTHQTADIVGADNELDLRTDNDTNYSTDTSKNGP